MIGLLGITSVRLPHQTVEATQAHLRRVGEHGLEGIALWAGAAEGSTFQVTHTVIPKQHGIRSADGVAVAVDPDELHRLNVWLFENRLRLVAQVHSHPTDAYHSDTDDAFPIATTVGSLSIVVPDFARRPFDLGDCAVYRLSEKGGWFPLPNRQVRSLIEIEL